MAAPIAIAITGASGAPYWRRLLQVLLDAGEELHLTWSPQADEVCRTELDRPLPEVLEESQRRAHGRGRLRLFERGDFRAPMASGSAPYQGMAIVPCSLGTLGRIAHGASDDLVTRAADVMLKERRRLVLLFRETPLSLVHLENMAQVTRAGAVVMPAAPGFYHRPRGIDDLVDFIVQRVCTQLGVAVRLVQPWGDDPQEERPS
jgi:4-hydroxy-3-polyprenylbenzoate decarboxylase